jgi:hypothetical protein
LNPRTWVPEAGTVSVSSLYRTSSVVAVPIIWLHITVPVVVISFSIIVSCIYFQYCWLLLIMYKCNKVGSCINVAVSNLFDSENISFGASLVMYTKGTDIPPIMIMNRMYEN